MPNWKSLAQSIKDEEAVLLLGPDAIPFYHTDAAIQHNSEIRLNHLCRTQIFEKLDGHIYEFYRRDNLFQFVDTHGKTEARKCMRNVTRDDSWLPDVELLRQIVSMPFPLILSLNPDKHLYRAFSSYWQKPQFDYFSSNDKKFTADLNYPTKDNPLVFNLCGSIEDNLDSVILDYHDLFQLIKNLLMDNGISEVITRKLQEVDRYIVLGVDLDRWYFQLFLQYLCRLPDTPFDNRNQSFPILSKASNATKNFVMRQFNIEHIAATRNDFEHLYNACDELGILRNVYSPADSAEVKIRTLSDQGDFFGAFKVLEETTSGNEKYIDIVHLRGRYSNLLQDYNAKRIPYEKYEMERNCIRYAMLTFAHSTFRQESV